MTKTIAQLCAAYEKEYRGKEPDFENPDFFYVETGSFPKPLLAMVAEAITPKKIRRMMLDGNWMFDDEMRDLINLFDYAVARGLIRVRKNPAQELYEEFDKAADPNSPFLNVVVPSNIKTTEQLQAAYIATVQARQAGFVN